MSEKLKQLDILNLVFNVHRGEWPRIGMGWSMILLYKIGFVLGWTVLVAMFVASYGILALPYLFVLNAVFSVIGTILYSGFLHRLSKEAVMIASIFSGGGLLFMAMYILSASKILFFGLLIVAVAIFLNQFRMTLTAYIEDMFSPLQSERAFPLVEGAETFAGIFAGLMITFLSNYFDPAGFIYIWIGCLFLIVPLVLFNKFASDGHDKRRPGVLLGKIKKVFAEKPMRLYVKGLFFIVVLQWILFNLVEFQYTSAVSVKAILDGGSGFEHALFHDLGVLFMLFSTATLVVQVFLGSRVLNSLGIIGTLLLHPVVTLLSLFGLTINYSFWTAVLMKNNFLMTTALYTNAYHSAYYVIKGNVREYVREILEGIVRPVGALVGTILIIIVQRNLHDQALTFYLNLLMILVAALLFVVTWRQQNIYTDLTLSDLRKKHDLDLRLDAVEILAQKGHRGTLKIMEKILIDKSEPKKLKLKILSSFFNKKL